MQPPAGLCELQGRPQQTSAVLCVCRIRRQLFYVLQFSVDQLDGLNYGISCSGRAFPGALHTLSGGWTLKAWPEIAETALALSLALGF